MLPAPSGTASIRVISMPAATGDRLPTTVDVFGALCVTAPPAASVAWTVQFPPETTAVSVAPVPLMMSPQFRATEIEPLAHLEEMRTMLAETVHEWTKDWVAQGREEGREQGRAEERRLLCRQAARKFDAGAAARLATALSDVADPKRLVQLGEWIIECETAADLMARVLDKTSAGD